MLHLPADAAVVVAAAQVGCFLLWDMSRHDAKIPAAQPASDASAPLSACAEHPWHDQPFVPAQELPLLLPPMTSKTCESSSDLIRHRLSLLFVLLVPQYFPPFFQEQCHNTQDSVLGQLRS